MAKKILFSFKKYNDDKLLAFVDDIILRMKDVPAYANEAAQLAKVITAQDEFRQAVANASEGGRTLKKIRSEKREALLVELQLLGMQLDMYLDKEPSFFTATGFLVRKTPVKHEGPIPTAVLKSLKRGILSGSVDGETMNFPTSVKQLAVEFSFDNGQTWQNGTYSTGKRFTLNNLKVKQECMVKVCFHGTRQRKSDWSEPLGVFVL